MLENEGLKREIGTWGLIANAINITIGAGIFIMPAIVAEKLGTGSIWAYFVCGALMILIMLCFAETGARITRSGGAYSYIEEAFGKYAGFLTTNIFIFGAAVMANAAVANGLADTLAYFLPALKLRLIRILLFAFIFGGLAYFNVKGVKQAIGIVKFNTIAKLTPLLMIGLFGWFFMSKSNVSFISGQSMPDFGEMTLLLLFAFTGAEAALNVSGEIKNPAKVIPKGIMLSMVAVVAIYVLIQITVQGILGKSITEFGNAPLAEAARRMIGPAGALVVLIGASFSMFGNLSGMVLSMPRVLFAAARDNAVPIKSLARIHQKFRTPHISILSYAFLGFIFASVGEFKQLAMLASASYLMIYLGVVLSVIKFRYSGTTGKNSFRIPGGYIIPVFSAIIIIWVFSNLPPNELIAMGIFVLLLTILYGIFSFIQRKSV
jgi:APA family basic amino acid/polyamine antiporter